MKFIYDEISIDTSKNITRKYSTSFSFGIYCLSNKIHDDIYSIYGFVRIADEIVDTFHEYNKKELLDEFRIDTYKAIERGISTNPVLNSFQKVVNTYKIKHELIHAFLASMEMDLESHTYTKTNYEQYILGSAEVVGLMCLQVFTNGDEQQYLDLKPYAMKLGAAFQKVNFLRDLNADYYALGRVYFPNTDLKNFDAVAKKQIEDEIFLDFITALEGIKKLPENARFGVYVAYNYYLGLFEKIKHTPAHELLNTRLRTSNVKKIALLLKSYLKYHLNLI